jgi:hypothetical protein
MTEWRHRRRVREVPFALVLLVEAAALASVVLAPQHWLRAVSVMAVGTGLAGLLRALLTEQAAGLLRVRRRLVDVCLYWGLALATVAFALALPQR